ncbi:MAG TPA: helicase-related protein [Nitrososphaeraceae archaeon]
MCPDQEETHPYVSHPLIRQNFVEFRKYQNNISNAASNRNTLVILPTALGKTVISLLVCAEMLYIHRDKRILVMAPSRPLVNQHTISFVSALKILEESIALLTGKISPPERRAIWSKNQIRLVFATPEVVKNDIEEKRLLLEDFSLLVFDEAHRAVKDYAYVFVAKEYFKQSPYAMILALTASPGSDKQKIAEICENLFIEQVEYKSEDDIDVKPYVNPIDVAWEWFDLPLEYQYIRSRLKDMLIEKINWLIQHRHIRKNPNWIFKRDLISVGEKIRYNLELTMDEERGPLYIALYQQSSALSLMYCVELIESQGSQSLASYLARIEEEGGKAHLGLLNDPRMQEISTLISNLSTEHPKLQYIVSTLTNRFYPTSNFGITNNYTKSFGSSINVDPHLNYGNNSENSRVLIFTQYRDTARHIVSVLSEIGIKASRFVGQARRQKDLGMKQDEQVSVLESFRDGIFNVLVATSIAEEGLDIPEVDLVIFYEPIPSEIRYIQRRGRTGRKSAGSVIILGAKQTVDERNLKTSIRRMNKMKHTLSQIKLSLKPLNRKKLRPNFMTSEDLRLLNENLEMTRSKIKKELLQKFQSGIDGTNSNVTYNVDKIISQKRKSLFDLEEEIVTTNFRRLVDKTARSIHSLLANSGSSGLDFDFISKNSLADDAVVIESLKKLEKLKRIEWIDDNTIVLTETLKKISGKTYSIYIKKIIQGGAVVMVDGKWHALLNHYDYEGPRDILKKGREFRVIGELYHSNSSLNIRIKQII